MQANNSPAKKKKYKSPDGFFLLFIFFLVAIGLGMLFSASAPKAIAQGDLTGFKFVKNQAINACIGIVLMLGITYFPNIYNWLKLPIVVTCLYLGTLVLLALVFTPLGKGSEEAQNIKRWVDLGFIPSFQPSELAKFTVPLTLAFYIRHNYREMRTCKFYDTAAVDRLSKDGKHHNFIKKYLVTPYKSFFKCIIMPFIIMGIPAIMIVIQPHMSGFLLLAGICFSIIFIGNMPINKIIQAFAVFAVIGGLGAAVFLPVYVEKKREEVPNFKLADMFETQLGRMENFDFGLDVYSKNDKYKNFFDLDRKEQDEIWQTYQGLVAIGSGGLTGLGITESRQKFSYLPEAQNDFIFAVICEELGFVGAVVIILLFIGLIAKGFLIAVKIPDKFCSLIVTAITLQVALQTLLNIVVVSGIINTGISLPFFSYGGTSLIMLLCEMGVILNLSRYAPNID